MNASIQLIRKLSFDSASSIEFDYKEDAIPQVNRAFFKPSKNGGNFKCLMCDGEPGHTSCLACKGKGTVGKGSPFMCFLDAIFQFKTHGQPILSGGGQATNKAVKQSTKIIELRRKVTITRSANLPAMRCSYMKKMSMVVMPTSGPNSHEGIQCDECKQYPIRGCRYACLVCQSYDLCGKCYDCNSHPHNFRQVEISRLQFQRKALHEYNRKSQQYIS